MSGEALVKYGSFDLDDMEELDEEFGKSDGAYFKVKVGRNLVRFLPSADPKGKPFVVVHEHQLNLPGGRFVNFACPRLMAKKPCRVCKKADQLKATGNPADFAKAKELFPKRRIYGNVIDRSNEEAGPLIYPFGKTVWGQLKDIREDCGNFTHPTDGFDIIIKREGTGMEDTKYTVREVPSERRPSHLGDLAWIEAQDNLSRFGRILTDSQIVELIGGKKSEENGGGSSESKRSETVVDMDFEEVVPDEDDVPFD